MRKAPLVCVPALLLVSGLRESAFPAPPQDPQHATVYVYRPKGRPQPVVQPEPEQESKSKLLEFLELLTDEGPGAGHKLPVLLDEVRIGRLPPSRYLVARVTPGVHTIRSEKKQAVRAEFAAAQEYFVLVDLVPAFPLVKGAAELVARSRGVSEILELKPLEEKHVDDPTIVVSGASFPYRPAPSELAYLGIEYRNLPAGLRQTLEPAFRGVLVTGVRSPGPAASAGIRVGDVVQRIDATDVRNPRELSMLIRDHRVGEEVRLTLWRNGESLDARVRLEDRLVLQRAGCEAGIPAWCGDFAMDLGSGLADSQKDQVRAVRLLEQACHAGDAGGCHNLGFALERGWAGSEDKARSAALYEKACAAGLSESCVSAGVYYENGWGVRKNLGRAVALYQRACDGGSAMGCRNIGYLYQEGMGVARDNARAARLHELGCDGGEPYACASLGFLYELGKGVPKDKDRAAALYEQGCRPFGPGRSRQAETYGCLQLERLRSTR